MEKHMLFATLDTHVRLIDIPPHQPFLLSDTVGFLHDLPHTLIEAFAATLSEAREADILLHVIDASDPRHDLQRQITLDTLGLIGCAQTARIEVMNKIDCCEDRCPRINDGRIDLCARKDEDMELLLEALDHFFCADKVKLSWLFPFDAMPQLSRLYAHAAQLCQQESEAGILVSGCIDPQWRSYFRAYEKTDGAQR